MFAPEFVVRVFGESERGPFSGTGFIVSRDGLVVTCRHVVEEAESIEVAIGKGDPWKYRLLAESEDDDLAILDTKVPASVPTPYLELPDEIACLNIGDEICAFGCSASEHYDGAQRFAFTVTGYSNPHARIGLGGQLNPGDSGGPVLNANGNLVGISQVMDPERAGQNMAIPIQLLFDLIDKHKLNDRCRRVLIKRDSKNYDTLPLADRRGELQWIISAAQGKCRERILLVEAESGFGKTTLLTVAIRSLPPKCLVFPISLEKCTIVEVLNLLRHRVLQTKCPNLRKAVKDLSTSTRSAGGFDLMELLRVPDEAERRIRSEHLTAAIFMDLRAISGTIVFLLDAFELATGEVKDWVQRSFLAHCAGTTKTIAILAGRLLPTSSIEWSFCSDTRKLTRIDDPQVWLEYAQKVGADGLTRLQIAKICANSQGIPRLIVQAISALK